MFEREIENQRQREKEREEGRWIERLQHRVEIKSVSVNVCWRERETER